MLRSVEMVGESEEPTCVFVSVGRDGREGGDVLVTCRFQQRA